MLRATKNNDQKSLSQVAIVETTVLTIVSLIFCYFIVTSTNAFSVMAYSGLLFGPLISGLRYGFRFALCSSLVIIVAIWTAANLVSGINFDSLKSISLGIFVLPAIAGEFRNYWERKIKKLEASSSYVDLRLGEVTNAFNILKTSHERIAQQVASQSTLRDNIIAVRSQIMKLQEEDKKIKSLAGLVLQLFSDYCSVQQAGFFVLDSNGNINPKALEFYGGQFQIDPHDLVLQEAIKTKKTTSLKLELATNGAYNMLLLVAIPIMDVSGRCWGYILVNKMPYRAFTSENMRLFAILAGYIADLVGMRNDSISCKDVNLQFFLLQLKRCSLNLANFEIPSCLVVTQVNNKKYANNICNLILERQRGLDNAWGIKNKQGEHFVFVLLPLTEITGTYGYKVRLQQIIKDQYDYANLESAGIEFYRKSLAKNEDVKSIMAGYFTKFDIDLNLLN